MSALCLMSAPTLGMAATGQSSAKPWRAPSRASRKPNPVAVNAQSLNLGKVMFKRECVSCHGDTGHGDGAAGRDLDPRPTDLTTAKVQSQSDGALFWKITKGRSPMPSYKTLLEKQERWSVINYMRFLAPAKDQDKAPAYSASGDIRAAVSGVLAVWMDIGTPLGSGELDGIRAQSAPLQAALRALNDVDGSTLSAKAANVWEADLRGFEDAATAFIQREDSIDTARAAFAEATEALVSLVKHFGHAEPAPVSVYTVTAGATTRSWLQTVAPLIKPYGTRGIEYHPAAKIAPSRRE